MGDIQQAVTAIAKSKVIDDVYKDAAQPSVRVVGKSLAQCASLFATPVGRMAKIFEKNIHRYLDKLEGLQEAEIISPDTRILVPILERMRYTDDEKVAEYYAQILATASTKEHANKVMVAFIEILNRLSADELLILEHINSRKNIVIIEPLKEEQAKKYGLSVGLSSFDIAGGFPIIDVQLYADGRHFYTNLMTNFNFISTNLKLTDPSNIDSYIDNMISLGLLKKQFGKQYAVKEIYEALEKCPQIIEKQKSLSSGEKIEFSRGRIDVTNLGTKLLNLCTKNTREISK